MTTRSPWQLFVAASHAISSTSRAASLPDGLSGAALTSAIAKLVEERPGLMTPGVAPPTPTGLDGGVRGTPAAAKGSSGAAIDAMIRARAAEPLRVGLGRYR